MAIGHRIINPYGEVIRVSQRTFDVLDMKGYLHRERTSGIKGMDPKHAAHFLKMENQTEWMREIGSDFQGPNVVICGCDQCLGKTRVDTQAECDKAIKMADDLNSQSVGKTNLRGRPGIGYI
jgi:hypothetical protein